MNNNNPKEIRQVELNLRQSGPDSYSGFVADDASGDSSIGHPQAGNQQSGIQSNFAKASPESNVGPAGAEQSSHGNASGGVKGVEGKSEAGQLNRDEAAKAGAPAAKPR